MPPPPTRLGPYEIVAKIAKGGMATVYLGRARAPNGRMRIVAIKAMHHELAQDAQFVTMFLDEAKILSRLDHGNIARTLEFGTEGESVHFIAMELLLGRTVLETWEACVTRGVPLRFDLAAWICARVADGLHYAHELCDEDGIWLNIVHRDVNPSNIFLTYDGQVKLFDFGLARAKGKRHKTQSGIVKGKVAYLSPEQLAQLPVDRRCDVFSLGATLWELTTMRRLFRKADDVSTARAIQEAEVPDPRQLVHDYPEALWAIVRRSLAKDRNDRYQRAGDVARDLDAFVGKAGSSMGELSGKVLENLFPGDREEQMGWLKTTSALVSRNTSRTMAPPARLPSVDVPSKPKSGYTLGTPKDKK